ncbi:hypothetical protein FEM48_Zijuj04G0007200 [Ziziphus jujuba var. spinosa]|uniref:Protease Do-like 2, chloroplastic n=1 Tax=Ziziphus jujuba var. spinosa TaxID=714518 RepID=A0A978VGU9_ZIZJJ|nr:hypothetical protein FEM48_Zijuj04G0007200 [Ziziphus jujuba var. spinosa]
MVLTKSSSPSTFAADTEIVAKEERREKIMSWVLVIGRILAMLGEQVLDITSTTRKGWDSKWSLGYKFGMQRKDKKELQYDLKDLSDKVESGNLQDAAFLNAVVKVKLKRRGDDTKYVAKVLARGVDCDIALLSVESKEVSKEAEPFHLGQLPRLQDSVTVVGYPFGGDTISVTKGVVSRIEVTSYAHGSSNLLGIQIDAATNSGSFLPEIYSSTPFFIDTSPIYRRRICVSMDFQIRYEKLIYLLRRCLLSFKNQP